MGWVETRAKKPENRPPRDKKLTQTIRRLEWVQSFRAVGNFEHWNSQIYPITSLISKLTSKIVRGHHHESSQLNESNFHQF